MNYEKEIESEVSEEPKNDTSEEAVLKPKKTKNKLRGFGLAILTIVAVIIIGVIAWNMFGKVTEVEVASVNNQKITQSIFDEFYLQQVVAFQSQGLDVNNPEQVSQAKQQALDNLINQVLFMQAAAKENVVITDQQVQSEYDRTFGQFETATEFQAALTENNLTSEQFRNNILTQLTIQQYLEPHIDQNVTVNDEEVQELYDQYKQQGSNIPALEEAKAQLVEQIRQQKINLQISTIIDSLKESAEIVRSEDLI